MFSVAKMSSRVISNRTMSEQIDIDKLHELYCTSSVFCSDAKYSPKLSINDSLFGLKILLYPKEYTDFCPSDIFVPCKLYSTKNVTMQFFVMSIFFRSHHAICMRQYNLLMMFFY